MNAIVNFVTTIPIANIHPFEDNPYKVQDNEEMQFLCAGRFAALQKQMGGHTDVYAVDNHSCVINAAMEELAKPERSVEQKTVKKNTPER